jgi:hypothetical protein
MPNAQCPMPYTLFLPILRWLIVLVFVLSLTSCGDKSVGEQVSVKYKNQPQQQISQQFSEVSPPAVIQQLGLTLDTYRPQVQIIQPQPDEILTDQTVTVQLQVKDLPIFQHPQWGLGPYLHLIVDNQPYILIYDLEKPVVLSDLSPGTHTLRVFASRPWHESFKNAGAYAETTFHLFTKTDDNNPDTSLPLLTYSSPQGDYGAEPILLDFYLTNAPLHLSTKDNADDTMSDWRIRCTINDESFVLDRWQSVYLKGFKRGINWVKLEFLDNQGNPVKNAFNTTVTLVNYQPKGKDTLSKITRGELTADEVRGIVDPSYAAKEPVVEPTPTPEPEEEQLPTPKVIETPQSEIIPTPQPSPRVIPTPPEVTPTPSPSITPEPQVEVTPTPSPSITPEPQVEVTPTPSPSITPEPQVEVTPIPLPSITPEPQLEVKPQPEVQEESPAAVTTPSPTATPVTEPELNESESTEETVNKPKKVNLGDYFKRRSHSVSGE